MIGACLIGGDWSGFVGSQLPTERAGSDVHFDRFEAGVGIGGSSPIDFFSSTEAQFGTSPARGGTLQGLSVKELDGSFETLPVMPVGTGSLDLRVPGTGIWLKRLTNCRDMAVASMQFIAFASPSLPFRASSLSANRFPTIAWYAAVLSASPIVMVVLPRG